MPVFRTDKVSDYAVIAIMCCIHFRKEIIVKP